MGIAGFKNLSQQGLGLEVTFGLDDPAVFTFNPCLAGQNLLHQHLNPAQHIQGLEPGHHTGHCIEFGQGAVGIRTDHRADMGRAEIAIDLKFGITGQGRHGCRHGFMCAEDKKVLQTTLLGGEQAAGHGRCRGFKPDAKKDQGFVRIFFGNGNGIKR